MVSFGAQKRGAREVIVTSHDGKDVRKYPISLGKHVLVQQNDVVRAGERLSDGAIDPHDVLRIKGVGAVQEYLVNEIQEVYRMQGVKINDKHIEVIVRQMMQKLRIVESGDTKFLEGDFVDKLIFEAENEGLVDKEYVINKGDSAKVKNGQLMVKKKVREINSDIKKRGKKVGGESRCGAGDVRAGVAGDYVCRPFDRQLHLRCLVPGDHKGVDRRCHRGEDRPPARPEGKRHHGSPDSCRNRAEKVHRPDGVAAESCCRGGRSPGCGG